MEGIFINQEDLYGRPRWYTLASLRTIKIWGLKEEMLENEIQKSKRKGPEENLFPLDSFSLILCASDNDLNPFLAVHGGASVL